jgi:hypothetical protein
MLMTDQTRIVSLDEVVRKYGIIEALANKEADNFTRIFDDVIFGRVNNGPYCNPFVLSFCNHVNDDKYERANGLLNQWRGYGGNGGFALVFETRGIIRLMELELKCHFWTHLNIGEIKYSVTDWKCSRECKSLLSDLEKFYGDFLNDRQSDPTSAYKSFVASATLLKHQGFREEREVRIVASPTTELMLQSHRRAEPNRKFLAPPKSILTRERGGQEIRYISLFCDSKMALPIKRVIVGPSLRQSENYESAMALSRGRFEVIRSTTPYVQF